MGRKQRNAQKAKIEAAKNSTQVEKQTIIKQKPIINKELEKDKLRIAIRNLSLSDDERKDARKMLDEIELEEYFETLKEQARSYNEYINSPQSKYDKIQSQIAQLSEPDDQLEFREETVINKLSKLQNKVNLTEIETLELDYMKLKYCEIQYEKSEREIEICDLKNQLSRLRIQINNAEQGIEDNQEDEATYIQHIRDEIDELSRPSNLENRFANNDELQQYRNKIKIVAGYDARIKRLKEAQEQSDNMFYMFSKIRKEYKTYTNCSGQVFSLYR